MTNLQKKEFDEILAQEAAIVEKHKTKNKTFKIGELVKISKEFVNEYGDFRILTAEMDIDEVNILNKNYSWNWLTGDLADKTMLVVEQGDTKKIMEFLLEQNQIKNLDEKEMIKYVEVLCIDKILNLPCYILEKVQKPVNPC